MNIKVKIGKIEFANPIMVASGTFGHAEKYYDAEEVQGLGAIVPKTVTLLAREGNPPRRIVETPSGMLNAIGIENPGADVFIEKKLPALKKTGVPLIISVLGHDDDQFIALIEKFNKVTDIAAIELNLSCPNLGHKKLVAQDAKATRRIVNEVAKISRHPIFAKLSPNVTDITEIAQAAKDAGADAVSLINTLTGMAIDIKTRRPVLGNVTGGLSGPAIRPVAMNMVYQVAKKVEIPVVAMGGVMTANDAIEFMIAGATMVAVGTYNFVNPRAPLEILSGIKKYLKEYKIEDINKLIGSVKA